MFQRQLAGEPVDFYVPEEGGTIWIDNMAIPKNAANPVDALMMMDFLYKPEIAAELTSYIQYVTPVNGVKDILAKGNKDEKVLAESPLIFPSEADYTKLRTYKTVGAADETVFNSIFQSITQG